MLYILSVKIYISHFWIMDHVLFLYVKFIRGVSTGMLTSRHKDPLVSHSVKG